MLHTYPMRINVDFYTINISHPTVTKSKDMIKNSESWSTQSSFKNTTHNNVDSCWWIDKLSMSPAVTSYISSRPYQLFPSSTLLLLPTNRYSTLILYISVVERTILVFFLPHQWYLVIFFVLWCNYTHR